NASELFPDPLRPVTTTSLSRGMLSVRFFRLCSRAPPILMNSLLTNFLLGARVQHSAELGGERIFPCVRRNGPRHEFHEFARIFSSANRTKPYKCAQTALLVGSKRYRTRYIPCARLK